MKQILFRSDVALVVVAVFSAAVLGGAHIIEAAGHKPCPLCLYQRFPYFVAIILSVGYLTAYLEGVPRARQPGVLSLATLGGVFIISALLAGYHVGVEQHWWASAVCGGTGALSGDPSQTLDRLLQTDVTNCDQVSFSVFGISLAGYNFLLSLGAAAYCFACSRRARKTRKPA